MNLTKSRVYNFSKEELQRIVNTSNTMKEVMRKVGLSAEGGNRVTLYRILSEYNTDISLLNSNRKLFLNNQVKNLAERKRIATNLMFVVNSPYGRGQVKNRILSEKLIEYKCKSCRNKGVWKNKILCLQLEHKNGINNDHRLENLCFLCPNCHSQTSTFAGKKNKVKLPKIRKRVKGRDRKLDSEQITFILDNKSKISRVKLGKLYNVSDKTIGKIIKNNGYLVE